MHDRLLVPQTAARAILTMPHAKIVTLLLLPTARLLICPVTGIMTHEGLILYAVLVNTSYNMS